MTCKVTFSLTDDNAIDIHYSAETDRTTVVNLTNHSYFNLDGDPSKDNSDYLLTINADAYTPVDSTFMTTGEIAPVENTDMDFRQPTAIGARINNDFIQLKYGKGYDHNWVLNTKGIFLRNVLLSNLLKLVSYSMFTRTNREFRFMPATSLMVR